MAICAAPLIAFLNLVAVALWPTWVAVAISETLRKVLNLEYALFFPMWKIDNWLQLVNFIWKTFSVPAFLCVQVITYVVTRPGRELLFTVVSQDEKYKAKVETLFSTTNHAVPTIPDTWNHYQLYYFGLTLQWNISHALAGMHRRHCPETWWCYSGWDV